MTPHLIEGSLQRTAKLNPSPATYIKHRLRLLDRVFPPPLVERYARDVEKSQRRELLLYVRTRVCREHLQLEVSDQLGFGELLTEYKLFQSRSVEIGGKSEREVTKKVYRGSGKKGLVRPSF